MGASRTAAAWLRRGAAVVTVAAGFFAVAVPASGATGSAASSVLTVYLPPAVAGQPYTQQVGFDGFNPTVEMLTAISGLPAGVSLAPNGIVSATPGTATGSYTITASIAPAPAAASTSIIDIELAVAPPGSSLADMVQGTPAPAVAELVTPLTSIPEGGRIACPGYTNCNTSSGPIGTDADGEWMTQWSDTGVSTWPVVNGYSPCNIKGWPVNITNNANGQNIGVYIDDTVDNGTSVANEEALVTCAYNLGARVIVTGIPWNNKTAVLDQPNGEPAGAMLEWYPYPQSPCNPQDGSGTNVPHVSAISELGYIVQQNFIWPNCSSGAGTNHQTLWNQAWYGYGGQPGINGAYDLWLNPTGHWVVSPYGDLLTNY
jgi:hypothetical protein